MGDKSTEKSTAKATLESLTDWATPKMSLDNLESILKNDVAVKVAGCDLDGVLRGKLMAKKKFLAIAKDGFGFCSVIFGWDIHDLPYSPELLISNPANGFRDIIAKPDLSTFRRIPWENNVPFFLLSFWDPETGKSLSVCPRSLLERQVDKLETQGLSAMAGAEYEFYQFRAPKSANELGEDRNSAATARYLKDNEPHGMPHLTEGMHGYSILDPIQNQDWFYHVFDACDKFNCGVEGWHHESGPGVFEAALNYGEIKEMGDKAALFKLTTKAIGNKYGMTPCFMAKPRQGLPGNSAHMHVSLVDSKTGANLFARETEDTTAKYPDLRFLSDLGRHFLAGLLDGLPDIMPIVAPTVNSYKRLVENYWAPVTVSWGLEHRVASIRLIAPPTASPKATRFEIRTPGADANPHLVLAAIVGLGWRGIEKKLEIPLPPLVKGENVGSVSDKGQRLAKTLKEATAQFKRPDSVAREIFGDEFVDHFAGTREHENRLWEEAITDWELRRYMEMV